MTGADGSNERGDTLMPAVAAECKGSGKLVLNAERCECPVCHVQVSTVNSLPNFYRIVRHNGLRPQ